jgi:proteasome lid subunit RPN8/RPN11
MVPELLSEMIAHAESSKDECCGFLIGHETADYRMVDKIMIANNVAQQDKSCRFEIAPLEYLKAEHAAEQNNLQLLGIYHSHPNHPAIPSALDRVAAMPDFSYVIVSVMEQKFAAVRSWRLNDKFLFEEEKITDNILYQSTN